MSAKHKTPEYMRNAATIRKRVNAAHRRGTAVPCWRCRRPMPPGTAFDVGHITGATGSTLADLAPEHRHRTGPCPGNRRDGGAKGAAKTNARRPHIITPADQETSWPI